MDENLIYKEYEMLRREIDQKISLQNNLLMFMITATLTLVTIATENGKPLLYLGPFFIIIPVTSRIAYYRKAIAKISSYMIVFLEPELDGISWETRNIQFIRRYNRKNKIKLDYYECLALSIICYLLYARNYIEYGIVIMLGPVVLVLWVLYLTYRINEFDKEREKMIKVWKNIERKLLD